MKKQKNNYIDKASFHEALKKYKNNQGGKRVEDFVGKCMLDICQGLSTKSNFSGYTYIEEMRLDAIENCIMAIRSYDVEHAAQNPFWYFSKIANWAFVRRIEAEKKENYNKHKNAQEYYLHGKIDDLAASELSDKVIGDFEKKQREIKAKKIEKERLK